MKDLMFSDGLRDQINFEDDFNFILARFGDIVGKLRSVSDINSDGKMFFHISTGETLKALSMIRKDYPTSVIISFGGEDLTFKLNVVSYTVDQESGETVLKIEGEHVQKK